ncbi:hypothetical protein A6R68_14205, partial [Neotoma lepida]
PLLQRTHIKAHRFDSHEHNALIILSAGLPQTMAVLGFKNFFSGYGCKLQLYIQGFVRSVSIGTTCCFSFFQSLNTSWDEISELIYALLVVCHEVFFLVLMAWSSDSLIVVLHRPKQRVQHIHTIHGSSRNSPESRVTWNILILVSTFLAFFTVSSTLRGSIILLYSNNWWLFEHQMDFWNLAIIFIFLSQTTVGILGNFSLIFYYLVLYYREYTLKPTDLILMHLTAANVLIVLSVGVPQTMAVLGFKHFLDNFGCKLLVYIQGFVRSVSIGMTCLLSVFQALTISPRKSCWKDHKVKVEKNIGYHISLLWIMYFSINFIHFAYTFVNKNSKNVTIKRDFEYCCTEGEDEIGNSLYAALIVCPEVFFSVLMAWSSGSLIVILYRHKQRVQHIYSSTHGSSRNSPESRVAQNILI